MSTDLVIVLSSDWVGSTATRADLGEEAADTLQEVHDTLLRRVIDSAGGRVVKHTGDGVLATFQSATAALGAAAKMLADFAAYRSSPDALAPVDIRIGLAAGDVKQQSGDIFGMPVIEAVRLQAAAEPNEILCSDLVRVLSQGRGGFEFEDAGRLQLKGLPSPVQARRVRRGEPPHGGGTTNVSALQPRAATQARPGGKLAGGAATAAARVPGASSTPRHGARHSRSIAVIPFENLSTNSADAYFATGIHQEILNQLTKLRFLRVLSRTTMQQYLGTRKGASEIASELNVDTIMEGSVRYADGRVLVTTQLVDGDTDENLWSHSYEHAFSNIFAIQSDIAMNVAQALQAELLPDERERVHRPPTSSVRAYDFYLSATALYWQQTPTASPQAIADVEQAIALDPGFALAWALRADAHLVAGFFDPSNAAKHREIGMESARRAVEIDPTLGRPYASLGFALFVVNDWIGSEAAFRTALSLNTPLGDVPAYSVLQLAMGNFALARSILQEARTAVPQNPTALAFLVLANVLIGDFPTAAEQYEIGRRLFSPWPLGNDTMMHALLARNEVDAARRIVTGAPLDAEMLALLDAPQEALRVLREKYAGADPVTLRAVALWAALLGDPAFALSAIRASVTMRGGNLSIVWQPQFAAARRLPEFKALLHDLGVVDYWRKYGWPNMCRPLGAEDFTCD